jgi:phenylalanine-4-hydroxylase
MYPATQIMRHKDSVAYSFEPDIIHDVFGHQACLLLPEVNQLHHKCGLASIVSEPHERELLSAIFWFSFEVGLCWDSEDPSQRKLLGGSLLSGIIDSQVAMDPRTKLEPLESDLSKILFTDIQYSDVQRRHIVCKPL